MADPGNIEKLVGKTGKIQGKQYVLKNDQFTIGSGSRCDLVIRGEYVSELHASITRRDDGALVLSNHSVNSTLVNRGVIDSKTLAPGDSIQIGAETLLAFEVEEPKSRGGKKSKASKAEKGGKAPGGGLLQRPGLMIGLALYLVVMLGGIIALSGQSNNNSGTGLSSDVVADSMQRTRAYLSELDWNERGITRETVTADAAANYYAFLSGKSEGGGDQALLDQILDDANAQLTYAWHMESLKRNREAVDAYYRVVEIIPDARAPVSRLALNQAAQLKANLD